MVVSQAASSLVSIIIPVATYHAGMADGAIAAASRQTIPCNVIVVEDTRRQGAGWARNEGVRRCDSLFVSFLDADDSIAPDFIERLISVWKSGAYVYCDDWQGTSLHQTPDCGVYHDGSWHSVNTLIPKRIFEAVGGFDENLPGIEDMDLHLRLQANGVCGIRYPAPLVFYTQHGKRSEDFKRRVDQQTIHATVYARYLLRAKAMCSCGGTTVTSLPSDKQDGDILVKALYTPMKLQGRVSGRWYPRPKGTEDYQLYVDHRDAYAMSKEFQIMDVPFDPKAMSPDVDTIQQMALQALNAS